jgi:hypothetical protein
MIRDLLALSGKMDSGALNHQRSTDQAALHKEKERRRRGGCICFQ